MRIEDVQIGQRVIYWPNGGKAEEGEVTEVRRDKYGDIVLVRYRGDRYSKATYAADLEPSKATP